MKPLAGRRARWVIWLALPLALAWLLRGTGLTDVQAILGGIHPLGLAGLAAYNLVVMWLFSLRWWLVLCALGYRLPYRDVFRYRTAGFAISYLTPGAQFGGEPLQVMALSQRHGLPVSAALASVTLDRLFELLANFTFLAVGITLVLHRQAFVAIPRIGLAIWIVGLLAVPLVYLALLRGGRRPLAWLTRRLAVFLDRRLAGSTCRLAHLIDEAERRIADLLRLRPRALIWVGLAAGLIWLLALSEYWLALQVLGARLDLSQTITALTAARLAFLTPLPGGAGALEAGQVFALRELGFGPALGLAISLWIRLRDACVGGLGVAFGAGLGWADDVRADETRPGLSSDAGD